MGICMKLQTAHLHPLLNPTLDAAQLYAQHSDLKHKLLRSAHTDHFTRTERDQMREVRIPRPSGHLFHKHPATDSTMIRPPIPRSSGHP
ncbi:hypothetical protein PVE_R2G0340 [Pseudomonas veronii 1YdBTEX2]|uniref:Uncharacterized protein n=1 Tax=Pseudomonas veronii 1YdBTEX2 TaxID=1295141 RepID=A0A1D3K7P0_PSEVE|nr:hypothetical protein PVE_R2G0340 [Pseudomonas veronii 1YdBTEX2]